MEQNYVNVTLLGLVKGVFTDQVPFLASSVKALE